MTTCFVGWRLLDNYKTSKTRWFIIGSYRYLGSYRLVVFYFHWTLEGCGIL